MKTNSISQQEIVTITRQWLGTPYKHQASHKHHGTDCLGLIRGVWRELYQSEPEIPPAYTPDWNEKYWDRHNKKDVLLEAAYRHLEKREDTSLLPGDVLIFRIQRHGPAKHCGIMTDQERFVHAYAGYEVCENWLNRWWRSRIAGVFMFPGVV